jgi:hypothetical protein
MFIAYELPKNPLATLGAEYSVIYISLLTELKHSGLSCLLYLGLTLQF